MVSGYQPASMEVPVPGHTPPAKCSSSLSRGISVKLVSGYGQISTHIPSVVLGFPGGHRRRWPLPSKSVLSSWRVDERQFRSFRLRCVVSGCGHAGGLGMRFPPLFSYPLTTGHRDKRSHSPPTSLPHISLNPQQAAKILKENTLAFCPTGYVSFGWDWRDVGKECRDEAKQLASEASSEAWPGLGCSLAMRWAGP